MAQLDPNIILGAKPVQIDNPVNNLAKMMQLQGLQQEGQMRSLQMQDAQEARASKNKLAELWQSSLGPDGQIDRNKLYQGAAQRGLGAQIPGLQKQFADADEQQGKVSKVKAETEKLQLDQGIKRIEFVSQLLGGVRDQASLDQTRAIAQQNGIDLSGLPAQYDPALIEQRRMQGLQMKDQLEQVWKQKGYDLDVQKFGETKRSNQASEANTRRGQDITLRGQNMTDARARERLEYDKGKSTGPDGKPSKPMPATALKLQNEALDMVGIASSIQADLGKIEQQIEGGKLAFGPVKNVANNLRNMAGASAEESRNFATFKSTLEKLRNDSLRLNKGVQTDGDAQRAWNELFQNINDTQVVKQRLAEIKAINSRAVDLRKREVDDIRNNYNQPAYDFTTQTNVPAAVGTAAPKQTNIDALLDKYK